MKKTIDDAADITDDVKKHLKSIVKNMKDGSFAEFKDGKLSFKFKWHDKAKLWKCQQIFSQCLKVKLNSIMIKKLSRKFRTILVGGSGSGKLLFSQMLLQKGFYRLLFKNIWKSTRNVKHYWGI